MNTLYILSIFAAYGMGSYQAKLIKANRPIRHGLWLTALIAGGYGIAWGTVGPWWALLALVGMGGLFSMWFRVVLNTSRNLLPSYMGPDASDTSGKRSQYDLLCWRIANKLGCWPIWVALTLEATAIISVQLIYNQYHP